MAKKKAAKKVAGNTVSKVAAKGSKQKTRSKSVKVAGGTGKIKPVSVIGLRALRDEMKQLAEEPTALSAAAAARLAKRAHTRLESFLKACGGVGNGQSGTKISVVTSGN